MVVAPHRGIQPPIDDTEELLLVARRAGETIQQRLEIVDQRTVALQANTLGDALQRMQNPGHRLRRLNSGGIPLPGADGVFQLLQLHACFLDKRIEEILEQFAAAAGAEVERDVAWHAPGQVCGCRIQGGRRRLRGWLRGLGFDLEDRRLGLRFGLRFGRRLRLGHRLRRQLRLRPGLPGQG